MKCGECGYDEEMHRLRTEFRARVAAGYDPILTFARTLTAEEIHWLSVPPDHAFRPVADQEEGKDG